LTQTCKIWCKHIGLFRSYESFAKKMQKSIFFAKRRSVSTQMLFSSSQGAHCLGATVYY